MKGIDMQLIVDRFEGDFAVCEDEKRNTVSIERSRLPSSVREGDVLTVDGDQIRIDPDKTGERRKKIKNLMKDLWE